ncbi:FecCD family ABC transporter permease [Alkalicoccobacillus murimartini]|uniref:Iron complex transport system permease protein n=1 Tax=Alkalicoccobacillus murimartini TaxID=171685 RepID=A0ABT9YIQ3_9BACI|nr:iron ABC transporter permease [Alkalicoccobacillus murimartini]MDQ0207740.1 iron complex transport system permease protein [Alkalicoccobacillus murimartini]
MSEWTLQKRTRRRKQTAIFLPLFFLVSAVGGLALGAVVISPQEIWAIMLGNNESLGHTILLNVRLPRLILATLAGACLAAAGAILQGVMQNPLADPSIIGVTAGGGLAASLAMVAIPQIGYLLPVLSFGGAFLTALLIYLFAWDKGASPLKIILAGVAINALLGAVQSGIMILYSDRVQSVLPWLAGGFQGRGWYHVEFVLPYAVIGLVLALLAIRPINLLLLGDEAARLLGTPVEGFRLLLIMLAALLAGAAVSVAGLVGFVGLVVPHMIRLLIGGDYRLLLPFSMIGGAALVMFTDTIARTAFDPIELPVGILLACMGAPFFLVLLKKRGLLF